MLITKTVLFYTAKCKHLDHETTTWRLFSVLTANPSTTKAIIAAVTFYSFFNSVWTQNTWSVRACDLTCMLWIVYKVSAAVSVRSRREETIKVSTFWQLHQPSSKMVSLYFWLGVITTHRQVKRITSTNEILDLHHMTCTLRKVEVQKHNS